MQRRLPARSEHGVDHHRCRVNHDSLPDVMQHSSAPRTAARRAAENGGYSREVTLQWDVALKGTPWERLGRLFYPFINCATPPSHAPRTHSDTLVVVSEQPSHMQAMHCGSHRP